MNSKSLTIKNISLIFTSFKLLILLLTFYAFYLCFESPCKVSGSAGFLKSHVVSPDRIIPSVVFEYTSDILMLNGLFLVSLFVIFYNLLVRHYDILSKKISFVVGFSCALINSLLKTGFKPVELPESPRTVWLLKAQKLVMGGVFFSMTLNSLLYLAFIPDSESLRETEVVLTTLLMIVLLCIYGPLYVLGLDIMAKGFAKFRGKKDEELIVGEHSVWISCFVLVFAIVWYGSVMFGDLSDFVSNFPMSLIENLTSICYFMYSIFIILQC
ncbi:TPA: hypothetical protein I7730_00780 [Vibrio vulnificus]|uniref:Uncharacterized protein n=1 Tax=Vibrio vulnificus TaxID=672 RepID=A0A8H9MYP1_VIBVL|nr:hypothetical protein [Vibrio vulnificus]